MILHWSAKNGDYILISTGGCHLIEHDVDHTVEHPGDTVNVLKYVSET